VQRNASGGYKHPNNVHGGHGVVEEAAGDDGEDD
jgi:hypothetical protein